MDLPSLQQHTTGRANNYPLYYFVPSVTENGRYLVFYSDRTGWIQHYRLDLESGATEKLTEGRTWDSGWAIWCEHHLRGIYNHISALDADSCDLYYFDGAFLESVSVNDGTSLRLYDLGDRIPVGQSAVSPDGRYLAFIHADRKSYVTALAAREALKNMGRFDWSTDHQQWRNENPTTISIFDIRNRRMCSEIELDYHVHHVLFLDNDSVIVNHIRDDNGMWRMCVDGSGERILRPRDENGAVCHQVVTTAGIRYEAARGVDGQRRSVLGAYDPHSDTFVEHPVREPGYIHTGLDPAGDLLFVELDGDVHGLYSGAVPTASGSPVELKLLRRLPHAPFGQRYHAHPFLSPDRRSLFFTELVDGFSQIMSIDVTKLVEADTGWLNALAGT